MDIAQEVPTVFRQIFQCVASTFDEVLILLNGVNTTDPQTGHASLDIPIELNMMERIEVLENYVDELIQAFKRLSGAINIITNTTDKRLCKAAVTGDTYGSFAPNLGFNYSTRKWRFMASASYNQSRMATLKTRITNTKIFFRAGIGIRYLVIGIFKLAISSSNSVLIRFIR